MTKSAWAKLKKSTELVNLYLKTGGRYVKGPYSGFNRAQRRQLERMEGGREMLRGFRARQRAAAVEEMRKGMLGEAKHGPVKQNKPGLVQRVRNLFTRQKSG